MRLIGQLADEAAARCFGDHLYVQGIENQIEAQKGEGWAIWINDEDKIGEAASLLQSFRANPSDAKYRADARRAASRREEQNKDLAAYRKKVRDRRSLFRSLTGYGFGPLTFVLIALSVVVAILSNFGQNVEAIMPLFIKDFTSSDDMIRWHRGLDDIAQGQVWRLITPIFIHFGPLHIIFNMWWLRDLGSMIEGRQTTWHLLALVIVIAAASNAAQFYQGGPDFGGMSGVVYGLLGYIWARGKFDPGSGLYLHPYTVTMMIIWFFACFTPLVPHVANAAHAVGLCMGLVWGWLSSLRHR